MSILLGLDIGTSSVKALVFEPESSRILAHSNLEYPIHRPQPQYAEQDPDDWWRAAVHAARAALAKAGPDATERVTGIGLSGQMHGTVLLDRRDLPVGPAIIWADQRAADYVERLLEAVGQRQFVEITGTLPAAGFMAVTLLWLAEHDPTRLRRARAAILPKDYVRLKLTGEVGTDFSDAAATGLFDIAVKAWSAEVVRAAGISRPLLPKVMASTTIAGSLTASAAAELGLKPGIPVAAGSADQPAQSVGCGVVGPGQGLISVSSGGQVVIPIEAVSNGSVHLPTDARVHVFNHAVPGLWYILGATLSAGLSLRWLRDLFGLTGQADAYALFSAEAGTIAPGADGLIFLPYLTGERTPLMDAQARGAFIGLTAYHTRAHLARAIMEGVAFSMRQAFAVAQELGGQADVMVANGGGMESDVWRGIMADVLGRSLEQRAISDHAALGAALIAGVAVGTYANFEETRRVTAHTRSVTTPDPARTAYYQDLFEQYTSLYPRLREDFHRLGGRAQSSDR